MPLIVGLGNPGDQYTKTRHNVGFIILDEVIKQLNLQWSKKDDLNAYIAEANISGEKVILAKPVTFMNRSGEAVQKISQKYKFDPCDTWIVYDEATMPFGTLRVRLEGSSGGHNGVKSVIQSLAAEDFVRLRVGVGEPPEPISMEDWVLSKFDKKQWQELEVIKEQIADRIIKSIKTGFESITENLSE